MGKLRLGDVYESPSLDPSGCPECAKEKTLICIHLRLKPRWKIWAAWFLRLLGWKGES